jgi:hypothetical protein
MNRTMIWVCLVLVIALAGGWYSYEMRAEKLANDLVGERALADRQVQTKRISLEEATGLIRTHLLAGDPRISPDIDYPLEETTPDEAFAKMGVQMFKVVGAFETGQDYIVQDGQVTRIGTYWGGGGIVDGKRTVRLVERPVDDENDGDGGGGGQSDRRYELHYVYATGSGVIIFMQGVYRGPGDVAEERIEKEGDY